MLLSPLILTSLSRKGIIFFENKVFLRGRMYAKDEERMATEVAVCDAPYLCVRPLE